MLSDPAPARRSARAPRYRSWWRSLVRMLVIVAGGLVVAFMVIQCWYFAHVLWWNVVDPGSSAFMEATLHRIRRDAPTARIHQVWVRYDRISIHLKRAVVAAEDARFLDHEGFDWKAIQKAMERNRRMGRVVVGASTISQQLAKNLFLSSERSWWRKGQEAIITWMLETVMTKRRILELYLNLAEWGDGVFGAEAASRRHFDRAASGLGPTQAAWLAAILPSPRRYSGGRSSAYLDHRIATIQSRMSSAAIP